jgi:hypothetical protein
MWNKGKWYLVTAMLAIVLPAIAQISPKDNSPVTRYGIGDHYRGDFNQSGATGGLFGAWIDPWRVNPGNPAALPYLRATALEFGFFSRFNQYRRNDATQQVWSGNLDYISLAFPLQSRINEMLEPRTSPWDFAMGVSVAPYSLVGYDVEFTQFITGVDTVRNIFLGQGGLSQASWSGGARYKNLSFGLQTGYVFGRLDNQYQLDLRGTRASYSTRSFSNLNLRGFSWQGGVIYRWALDPKEKDGQVDRNRRFLQFGIYGGSNTPFRTVADRMLVRVNEDYSAGGSPIARDTVLRQLGVRDQGLLPGRLGGGVTFQRGERMQVGINAEYRDWSVLEVPVAVTGDFRYRHALRLSAGGEWTPDPSAFRQYFRRVTYRAGLFLEQDPRVIQGYEANGYGLQMGFGFPIILPRQQVSFLDFAIEAGRRGHRSVQQDNYIRLRLAATLNDNSWFFKRKYN